MGWQKSEQAVVEGRPVLSEFQPWMILTGPTIHLLFLPFCVVFLTLLQPFWCSMSPKQWIGFSTAISILVVLAMNSQVLPTPLPQRCSVVPAACLGLAMTIDKYRLPVLALFCPFIAIFIALGWSSFAWQLLISTAAILAYMLIVLPSTSTSRALSELSLGIYLMHPLVLAFLGYVMPLTNFMAFDIAILASIAGTMVARKIIASAV